MAGIYPGRHLPVAIRPDEIFSTPSTFDFAAFTGSSLDQVDPLLTLLEQHETDANAAFASGDAMLKAMDGDLTDAGIAQPKVTQDTLAATQNEFGVATTGHTALAHEASSIAVESGATDAGTNAQIQANPAVTPLGQQDPTPAATPSHDPAHYQGKGGARGKIGADGRLELPGATEVQQTTNAQPVGGGPAGQLPLPVTPREGGAGTAPAPAGEPPLPAPARETGGGSGGPASGGGKTSV